MKIKDIMNPTFSEEYELMLSIGQKKYGSVCRHEKVRNGICVNCKRKVISKIGR